MTRSNIALIDIAYWPMLQLSIGAMLVRLPMRFLGEDNAITRIRKFERSLHLYRTLLVPRWKKQLPDAAFLVGGRAKRVNPYCYPDMCVFLADLRCAEIAHWLQLLCAIPCWFWNPVWASTVMTAYAICTNVPCITVQRYNRILIQRRMMKRPIYSTS